jgi:hypothetical protein
MSNAPLLSVPLSPMLMLGGVVNLKNVLDKNLLASSFADCLRMTIFYWYTFLAIWLLSEEEIFRASV